MAEVTAVLPAEDAMTVFTALDAIAQSADPADPRPVDARRADALTDLCRNLLAVGYAPPMSGCHADDDGAHRGGQGSRAGADRRSQWRRRRRGGGPQIQVTVAATTLLGVDDRPGELAGCGPIPAEVARQLAADPDASWRRILTDPASGVLLDYGTTVYRPPPALARHVRARDQVCAFPGCRQPAVRCDLDHRTPYPHGPTCADNSARCAATTGPRPTAAGAGSATTTAPSSGPDPPATDTRHRRRPLSATIGRATHGRTARRLMTCRRSDFVDRRPAVVLTSVDRYHARCPRPHRDTNGHPGAGRGATGRPRPRGRLASRQRQYVVEEL